MTPEEQTLLRYIEAYGEPIAYGRALILLQYAALEYRDVGAPFTLIAVSHQDGTDFIDCAYGRVDNGVERFWRVEKFAQESGAPIWKIIKLIFDK